MDRWGGGIAGVAQLAGMSDTDNKHNTAEPEFKTLRMGGGDICAFDKKCDLWEKKKEQV